MRYFNLITSGGENELKEYPTEAERDAAATDEMAELSANSGLFDDAVLRLDSESPITVKELADWPTPQQIQAKRDARNVQPYIQPA